MNKKLFAILLLGVAAAGAAELFTAKTRARTFDRFWKQMARHYDYFDVFGVDWEASREKHREKVIAAEDHAEFLRELALMFCPLRDPHLSLVAPRHLYWEYTSPRLGMLRVGDRLLVNRWPPGYVPAAPPKFRGDADAYPEIVSINGGVACPKLAQTLMLGVPGTTVPIIVEWPGGERTTERLPLPRRRMPQSEEPETQERLVDVAVQGELAYVAIRSFSPRSRKRNRFGYRGLVGEQLAELEKALDGVINKRRLILDLRYNGGGDGSLATAVLGYFIDERIRLAVGHDEFLAMSVIPRERIFRGDVTVLVNEYTASAGEMVAAFLRRFAGARIVGSVTVGAEAPLISVEGDEGSTLLVGFGSFNPRKNPTYQGTGVKPDTEVPLTMERVREEGVPEALVRIERERFDMAVGLMNAEKPTKEFLAETQDRQAEQLRTWFGEVDTPDAPEEERWPVFLARIFPALGAQPVDCPDRVADTLRGYQIAACATVEMKFAEFKKQWPALLDELDDFWITDGGNWTREGKLWRKRRYLLDGIRLTVWFSESNRALMLTYG